MPIDLQRSLLPNITSLPFMTGLMSLNPSHTERILKGGPSTSLKRSFKSPKDRSVPASASKRPRTETGPTLVTHLPTRLGHSAVRRFRFPKPRRPLKPLDFKAGLINRPPVASFSQGTPTSSAHTPSPELYQKSLITVGLSTPQPRAAVAGGTVTLTVAPFDLVTHLHQINRACSVLGPRCPTIGGGRGLWPGHDVSLPCTAYVGRPATAGPLFNGEIPEVTEAANYLHRQWICQFCTKAYKQRPRLVRHLPRCRKLPAFDLRLADLRPIQPADRDAGISYCVCVRHRPAHLQLAAIPGPPPGRMPGSHTQSRRRPSVTLRPLNHLSPESDATSDEDSESRPMIQCDQCFVWLHMTCVGIDEDRVPDVYSCPRCASSSPPSNPSASRPPRPGLPIHPGLPSARPGPLRNRMGRPVAVPGRRKVPLSPNSAQLEQLLADMPETGVRSSLPLHAQKPPPGRLSKCGASSGKSRFQPHPSRRSTARGPDNPSGTSLPHIPPANMFTSSTGPHHLAHHRPSPPVTLSDAHPASRSSGHNSHTGTPLIRQISAPQPNLALLSGHAGELGAIHPDLLYSDDPAVLDTLTFAAMGSALYPSVGFSSEGPPGALAAPVPLTSMPPSEAAGGPPSLPVGPSNPLWDFYNNTDFLSSQFALPTDHPEGLHSALDNFDMSEADFFIENLLSEADLDLRNCAPFDTLATAAGPSVSVADPTVPVSVTQGSETTPTNPPVTLRLEPDENVTPTPAPVGASMHTSTTSPVRATSHADRPAPTPTGVLPPKPGRKPNAKRAPIKAARMTPSPSLGTRAPNSLSRSTPGPRYPASAGQSPMLGHRTPGSGTAGFASPPMIPTMAARGLYDPHLSGNGHHPGLDPSYPLNQQQLQPHQPPPPPQQQQQQQQQQHHPGLTMDNLALFNFMATQNHLAGNVNPPMSLSNYPFNPLMMAPHFPPHFLGGPPNSGSSLPASSSVNLTMTSLPLGSSMGGTHGGFTVPDGATQFHPNLSTAFSLANGPTPSPLFNTLRSDQPSSGPTSSQGLVNPAAFFAAHGPSMNGSGMPVPFPTVPMQHGSRLPNGTGDQELEGLIDFNAFL